MLKRVLLKYFMAGAATFAIAFLVIAMALSAARYAESTRPRAIVVTRFPPTAKVKVKPRASVVQQRGCVPQGIAGATVGGLGGVDVPRLPGAVRTNYDGNGVSEYMVKADGNQVLGYYLSTLASGCWELSALQPAEAVWRRGDQSLRIAVAENPLGGRSVVDYEAVEGQVRGVTFHIAQLSCSAGQVPCTAGNGENYCYTSTGYCPTSPIPCTTPLPSCSSNSYTFDGNGCPSGCSGTSGGGGMTCTSAYSQGTINTCSWSMCPSGCTYDSQGCATGCSGGTTGGGGGMPCTSAYSQGGINTCTWSMCPNGCNYDSQGCATGCTGGTTGGTSCSGAYSQGGTYTCNYSTCPSGCSYDSQGCPSGCYTPATCSGEFQQTGSTSPACNWTRCPSGCTWDSNGCPSGCSASGGGSGTATCGSGQITCWDSTGNRYCYTGTSCPPATGGTGTSWPTTQTDCTAQGKTWCPASGSSSGACYYSGPCPVSCASGQYWCPSSASCKPTSDTYCPSSGGGGSCGSGFYWCNGGCIASGFPCSSTGGGAATCGSGQISCWDSTGRQYCYAGTSCPISNGSGSTYAGDANSCPGFAYSIWDSFNRRCCRLNNEARCDCDYPSYLTNGGNYTAAKCPATTTGGSGTSSGTCPSGQNWCYSQNRCVNPGEPCSGWSSGSYTTESSCTDAGGRWCQKGTSTAHCHVAGDSAPCEDYPSDVSRGCGSGKVWCSSTYSCIVSGSTCSTGGMQNANWIRHTWTFSNGATQSSYILSRTDAEYTTYIAGIEQQCRQIEMSRFAWKPNAGNDASSNWQNFGIPDCSGTASSPVNCLANQFWCPSSNSCLMIGTPCSSTTCGSGLYWCPQTATCIANGASCGTATVPISPTPIPKCGQCQKYDPAVGKCMVTPYVQNAACGKNGWCDGGGGCVTLKEGLQFVSPYGALCPNQMCEEKLGEHSGNCPKDCGTSVPPPPSPSPMPVVTPMYPPTPTVSPYPGQFPGKPGEYPGGPGGPYVGPGGPAYPTGPSEEDIKRAQQDQFSEMKRDVTEFRAQVKGIKMKMRTVKPQLTSCGITLPAEFTTALDGVDKLLQQLDRAQDIDQLGDAMTSLMEAAAALDDGSQRIGDWFRLCEYKKRAKTNVSQLESQSKQPLRQADRKKADEGIAVRATALRELISSAKELLTKAAGLVASDPDAALLTYEELYGVIDDGMIAKQALEAALNARSTITKIKADIRRFESELKRQERSKKDVTLARELVGQLKAQVADVEEGLKQKIDSEELFALLDILFQTRNDVQDAMADLMGRREFAPVIKPVQAIQFQLPEGFKSQEYGGGSSQPTPNPVPLPSSTILPIIPSPAVTPNP